MKMISFRRERTLYEDSHQQAVLLGSPTFKRWHLIMSSFLFKLRGNWIDLRKIYIKHIVLIYTKNTSQIAWQPALWRSPFGSGTNWSVGLPHNSLWEQLFLYSLPFWTPFIFQIWKDTVSSFLNVTAFLGFIYLSYSGDTHCSIAPLRKSTENHL